MIVSCIEDGYYSNVIPIPFVEINNSKHHPVLQTPKKFLHLTNVLFASSPFYSITDLLGNKRNSLTVKPKVLEQSALSYSSVLYSNLKVYSNPGERGKVSMWAGAVAKPEAPDRGISHRYMRAKASEGDRFGSLFKMSGGVWGQGR